MAIEQADRAAIEQCSKDSLSAARPFPEIVGGLSQAGVGSYFADYRSGRTVYFARSGGALDMPLPTVGKPIAEVFDAQALQSAIKGAQRGEVLYPRFLELSMAAGCVGYHTWIDGRHVLYVGARGETHVERFPGAN